MAAPCHHFNKLKSQTQIQTYPCSRSYIAPHEGGGHHTYIHTWHRILVSLLIGSEIFISCAKASVLLKTLMNWVCRNSKVTSGESGICPLHVTREASVLALGVENTFTPNRPDTSFQPSSEDSYVTRAGDGEGKQTPKAVEI